MNGLTNYITDQPWEDTITTWYVLVDDAYQRILAWRGQPLRAGGPAPTFADSEVITVALIIETFFQGHEEVGYAFVRQYLRALFPRLLDLDRFNARRCDLRDDIMDQSDPIRLVDCRLSNYGRRTPGGVEKSALAVQNQQALDYFLLPLTIVPFDEGVAATYGEIRVYLEAQGTPIGALDTLLGAQAVSHKLIFVTNNVREFAHVPGLTVEDWTKP